MNEELLRGVDLIETSELLRRAGCTRNQLNRLRREYPEVAPARSVGHGLLLWPADMAAKVRSVLQREQEADRG